MDDNWHKRLKESREKSGLTLRQVCDMSAFDISQQSLIKYEQGEVFPRIDLLDKMCKKYNVTIDYIMYGTSDLSKTNSISGQLVSLFMLMHSEKLTYNEEEKTLIINDRNLIHQIMVLNTYLQSKEISSTDDLSNLITAIKMMSREK